MKLWLLCILTGWLTVSTQAGEPALIPLPQEMRLEAGHFTLSAQTPIYADPPATATAQFLAARLAPATGWMLPVRAPGTEQSAAGGILLTTNGADAALGDEGYTLTVATHQVVIRAPTAAGLFYGVQTLRQLLPPEIFSSNSVAHTAWQAPCVQIKDWPRFPWRGLMVDVSRHFFSKLEVERLLDAMALHKLNVFHWHLVDDQGWRIEIKKYPRLTSVGAWRDGVGFGLASNAATAYGPDGRYGGYYTQADIREVVAYAAARHIMVVPEIEIPGHSLAALAAYPQFGTGKGPFVIPTQGGVYPGVYDPAKPETFQFLEDALTEVFQLFPSRYVHIGGDEVPPGPWEHDAACRALMQREGLKRPAQLESWFIRRINQFVRPHDKTIIGWSETVRGGLAPGAVVMDWIGGGKEAARQGHDAIMTPMKFCYFSRYQSTNFTAEPRGPGHGYTLLPEVYSFEPVPAGLTAAETPRILGAQGSVWTEHIANARHLEYMIFPRESALAEVTWSAKPARNFASFQQRLKTDQQRLEQMGINFRRE